MTQPIDHAAREAAASQLDTTFFVEAAAGTGKTTALVGRIVNIVACGRARLHEVVAITFTEKAAGELKIRLREELEKTLAGEALRAALGDLERAQITTIHSFCAALLRERPVEARIDPQFVVADDLQRELLLDEAWKQWLESQLALNPPVLREALVRELSLDALRALAELLITERARHAAAQWPAAVPVDMPALRCAAPFRLWSARWHIASTCRPTPRSAPGRCSTCCRPWKPPRLSASSRCCRGWN